MKFLFFYINMLAFSSPASSSYPDACSAIENQRKVQRVVTYDQNMIHAAQSSRALARFALEHPSEEIKALVQDLFSGFGRLILRFNLKPEDLRFLLESVPDARSSFSMKYEPMVPVRNVAVDDAFNMLRDAASGIFPKHFDSNFSDYASDIDTWMTAISYRMIGPSWIKNTYKKSDEMSAFLREGRPYLIPGISKEFPHREQDARYWIDDTVFECPGMTQEPYRDYPVMDGMPARYFRARSYVANSLMTGVPMRAHVSGSAPLTLAAMKFVFEKGLYSYAMNSELTQILLSGLIIALFDCGDFHTLSESAAGVSYYYQSVFSHVDFHPRGADSLESVTGRNWLGLSLGYLSRIVSEGALQDFLVLSQELLELVP